MVECKFHNEPGASVRCAHVAADADQQIRAGDRLGEPIGAGVARERSDPLGRIVRRESRSKSPVTS